MGADDSPVVRLARHGQEYEPELVREARAQGWTNIKWDWDRWVGEPPGGNGGVLCDLTEDPRVQQCAAMILATMPDPNANEAVRRARLLVRSLDR